VKDAFGKGDFAKEFSPFGFVFSRNNVIKKAQRNSSELFILHIPPPNCPMKPELSRCLLSAVRTVLPACHAQLSAVGTLAGEDSDEQANAKNDPADKRHIRCRHHIIIAVQ